ncbi:ATP-binding protein [Sutcliffiella horikoshii]|uniref:ATP-binding protein n=1 Tax=Sutcliffiella horikoshii TaxID=79883 RepID=UPI003CE875D3
MPYYQIEKVNYSKEADTYFIYQGKKELDVQLNFGYSAAKDLVDFIYHSTDENHATSLFIRYQNERMHYFLKSDQEDIEQNLSSRVPQCEWRETDNIFDNSFAKEKVILRGSASPLVIKDRDENLLDELVRMFPKENFLIQVKLNVKNTEEINKQLKLLELHMHQLSEKTSVQVGEQGHFFENIGKAIVGGENLSYQQKNITAEQQLEVLENHIYTLKTQGHVFNNAEYVVYGPKGIASMVADKMEAFSRRSGSLHLHHLGKNRELSSIKYLNYVPASYIASVIAFPTSDVPGVKVNKRLEFGVDLSGQRMGNALTLGKLIKHHQTDLPVQLPLRDFTRHTFISGVTGSGKTSTIKSMLMQAYKEKVPFLVLEPAKTEYKYLENRLPGLKRYTLGIEGSYSFKINPFAFPINIHLQTHVDYLKSVFVAAFPMYGPMPFILETALYNVYRQNGWDFISGRNIHEAEVERNELFPTLEDLYLEIDDAIEKVGYSADVSSDVRGALKVRIGSLLNGAKGAMLNTKTGNSIEELLQSPAIIELEYLGDDQEKVFLMGLLLISIYEHYISEGTYTEELGHLLVIEEAHRLLENTDTSTSNESANMKGKALETFNNVLSEIRAYGEGLIIADQIPTKLSPDIIKNTNLKIIHRLFSKEDRLAVGESIGLKEEEIDELIRLKQGEAVIFHGKVDTAMKLNIHVDSDILASHSTMPSKKLEQLPLDPIGFTLQDDKFRQETYRLINTFFLFPEKKEFLNQAVSAMMYKRYGLEIHEGELDAFWYAAIQKYIKENRLAKGISFKGIVNLSRKLEDRSSEALEIFREWGNLRIAETHAPHKMERLSAAYQPFAFMRKFLILEDKKLKKIVNEYGDRLVYSHQPVIDILLKEAQIDNIVEMSLLNKDQINILCNAMMLYEFKEQLTVLEKYFEFVRMGC